LTVPLWSRDPEAARRRAAFDDHRRIAEPLIQRALANARARYAPGPDPAFVALAGMADEARRSVAIALIADGLAFVRDPYITQTILSMVMRGLPLTREDVQIIAGRLVADGGTRNSWTIWYAIEIASTLHRSIVRLTRDDGLGDLEQPVREIAELIEEIGSDARAAKVRARFLALLDDGDAGAIDPVMFGSNDTWGTEMARLAPTIDAGCGPLLRHLGLADSVTPTASWRAEAAKLVRTPAAGAVLRDALELATTSESTAPVRRFEYEGRVFLTVGPNLEPGNSILVRGAIWAAAILDEPWAPDVIGRLGLRYGTSGKSDNIARDERVANAAAAALAVIGSDAAFAELGRMRAKITNRNVSKQVAKALEGAAVRAGVSPSELLELSVPSLGFDADGTRTDTNDGWASVVRLVAGGDLERSWIGPDGTAVAKPPAAVDGAWVKRLKETDKEIRRELAVERGRVEDLLVESRDWPLPVWRARYLEHPVTRQFGRMLIWRFRDAKGTWSGLPIGDEILGADGVPLVLADDARVLVWHPIGATEAEVAAWRDLLVVRQIRQPFKQAFREVYRLTPAEETTETYSNRYAGHILHYPQARALMTARRWGSNFLGPFDGGYNGLAKRDFPTARIRAEFYHDAVETEAIREAVRHCTTDQVRFYPMGPGPQAVARLVDVSATVFSEAMRDVDLFVGVSSVAADQNWQDAGPDRRPPFEALIAAGFHEELTSSARVRRDVLERILPGLAIADRCELIDRWLRVRGDVRTYKIHLGSGNILMEPADTYLCIVPARGGATESIFLPFDDDTRLSLILSKAFLLANDRKIRDQSIIRQIEAR
jgi:hypothetical protein